MRRVKQISIVDYIANCFIGLLVIVSLCMLVIISILSNAAVMYDIKNDLNRDLRHCARDLIYYDDGTFDVNDQFIFEEEGRSYIILDNNGKIYQGKYPSGFTEEVPVGHGKLRLITSEGGQYYVLDRREYAINIAIRCVVKKEDISSRYVNLKYFSFICIPIILIVGICSRKVLKKSVLAPVYQITETAEDIGKEKDLSKRIDYNGRFQEFSILSQANNRMLERLENMFETQKQFTSDVTHELRTPVTVLLAQCEYSKKHSESQEELQEAIEVVKRQAEKMNEIVVQMLNLSRLDQDRIKMNCEWIDIGEIVKSICEDIALKETRQIAFDIKIPRDTNVYADICLMMILIQNLIDNAVKYSPEQSTVRIWSEETKQSFYIHIKDEGCGISQENQEKIFQRFFRVEKTEDAEGFGLGLSLAKRIAEKHGGTITVSSQLGKGSIFTLQLPKGNELK